MMLLVALSVRIMTSLRGDKAPLFCARESYKFERPGAGRQRPNSDLKTYMAFFSRKVRPLHMAIFFPKTTTIPDRHSLCKFFQGKCAIGFRSHYPEIPLLLIVLPCPAGPIGINNAWTF